MLREELAIREQEAQNFEKFIGFLESGIHFSETAEINFNKMMIVTNLKASVIILLYNAVEATITKCLNMIHEELKRKSLFYDQCNDELKKLAIVYYKYAEMKSENLHNSVNYYMTGLDFNRGLIPFSLSYDEMTQYYPLYSGNLDSRTIKNVLEKYGIEFDEKVTELKTIKDKRNALAHGESSFEEIGRDISRQQICVMVDKTFEYLGRVVDTVEEYLDDHRYLSTPT